MASDPLWEKFRPLTNQLHLGACWSLPLVTWKDKVLGTFAIYLKQPRHPSEVELNTLNRIRYILTILIEQSRALQEIRMMNERFDNMMKATNDLIWDMNVETRQFYRSPDGLEKVYGIK